MVTLMVAAIPLTALPARADVTGGCDGSAVIDGVTYTPANDTPSNPVVIPGERGVEVVWEGSTPFDNDGHAGSLHLHLGPTAFEVADWQDDNGDLPNESSAAGVAAVDALRDEVPFPLRGLYRVSGGHAAGGGACNGFVMLKFDGALLASPVAQGATGAVALSLLLVVFAGVASASAASAGRIRGRRVLGTAAGLLLGVSSALLLQQASVWPLDTLSTIVLPVLVALLAGLFATWAPLARGRLPATVVPSAEPAGRPDPDAPDAVTERIRTAGPPAAANTGGDLGVPDAGGEASLDAIDLDRPVLESLDGGEYPTIEIGDHAPLPLLANAKTDPCAKLRASVNRLGERLEDAERVRQEAEHKVAELEAKLAEFERKYRTGLDREDAERRAGVSRGSPLTEHRRGLQNDLGMAREFAAGALERVTREEFEKDLERLRLCEQRAAEDEARARFATPRPGSSGGPDNEHEAEPACCQQRLWYGLNLYVGGSALVFGPEAGRVYLWCVDDSSRSAVVQWAALRYGPGLGGEVTAAFFVVRGPTHPAELVPAVEGVLAGWDWDLSVGLSLRKLLGTAYKAGASKELATLTKDLAKYLKSDAKVLLNDDVATAAAQAQVGKLLTAAGGKGAADTLLDGGFDLATKGTASGAQAGGTGANVPLPLPTALQVGLWKLASVRAELIDLAGCARCDPSSMTPRPV